MHSNSSDSDGYVEHKSQGSRNNSRLNSKEDNGKGSRGNGGRNKQHQPMMNAYDRGLEKCYDIPILMDIHHDESAPVSDESLPLTN